MKLLFTGGGTLGSVMPLLGVLDELRARDASLDFLWVGTASGPERKIIEARGIRFVWITAGKLRRYFDWRNILLPLQIFDGLIKSLILLAYEKPSAVISAGGFVGVPLIWAAWICRVPVLIHQEDVVPGLANRLAARAAEKITVTFEKSAEAYPAKKTIVLGNPVRPEIFDYNLDEARGFFNLESGVPVVFVTGGGTGSAFLNNLVWDNLSRLTVFCQIIHSAGIGKLNPDIKYPRYHQFEILTEGMANALAVADLIVSRAGMGALSEFAALGKPVILIPLPGHQEANAEILKEKNAAVVWKQSEINNERFVAGLKELLADREKLSSLGQNIHVAIKTDVRAAMADLIMEIIGH